MYKVQKSKKEQLKVAKAEMWLVVAMAIGCPSIFVIIDSKYTIAQRVSFV